MRLVSQLLQTDPDAMLDRPSARLTWAAASQVYPDAPRRTVQRAMRMCFILLVTQLAQMRASAPQAGHALDLELADRLPQRGP